MKKIYLLISIFSLVIPIVIGVRCVEASVVPTSLLGNGLVAYWKLDEATTSGLMMDSSGYGNHLVASTTIPNAVKAVATTSVPSQIKFADPYSTFFTGGVTGGQFLIGSTSASLQPTSITMSVWFRATSTIQSGSPQQSLISYTGQTGADRYGYGMYMSVNTTGNNGTVGLLLGAGLGAGGWNTYNSVKNSWTANTWYNIVMTLTGTTYKIYVNGVLDSTGVAASIKYGFQFNTSLCSTITASYTCSGTLDDVRIYNRALLPSEVSALYSANAIQYKPTNIKDHLIAYWKFDEGYTNARVVGATGGNNGTPVGSPTYSTNIPNGLNFTDRYSLSLNGSSQYVTLGTSNKYIKASSSPISVSLWFKATSIGGVADMDNRLFSVLKGTNSSSLILSLGATNKVQYFDGTNIWTLPTVVTTGVWHQLIYVYNGTSAQMYLDGVANGTSTTYALIPGSTQLANIGTDAPMIAHYFNGLIDDVRVYDIALTSADISSLYGGGMNIKYSPTIISHTSNNFLSSGLLGYWNFDGQSVNYTTGNFIDSVSNQVATTSGLTRTTMLAPGKTGSAVKFLGTTQYVVFPTPMSVQNKSEVSLSFWVYMIDNATRALYVETTSGGNQRFAVLNNRDGANKFSVAYRNSATGDGGTRQTISSNVDTKVNQWSHIVATYSVANSRIRLYVNGVQVASSTANITAFTNTAPEAGTPCIGCASGISSSLLGTIDGLRMYNRELTPADITQLYLSGM